MARSILKDVAWEIDPGLSQELYGGQVFQSAVDMIADANRLGMTPDAIGLNRRDLEAASAWYWAVTHRNDPWIERILLSSFDDLPIQIIEGEVSPVLIYKESS